MPWEEVTVVTLKAEIAQLKAQVDELTEAHATWLAKIENDRAIDVRKIDERINSLWNVLAQLTQSSEVTSTVELQSFSVTPEVTISHDQLANGRWRYKTSVTMAMEIDPDAPEGLVPASVARALATADQLAREEAARRTGQDENG